MTDAIKKLTIHVDDEDYSDSDSSGSDEDSSLSPLNPGVSPRRSSSLASPGTGSHESGSPLLSPMGSGSMPVSPRRGAVVVTPGNTPVSSAKTNQGGTNASSTASSTSGNASSTPTDDKSSSKRNSKGTSKTRDTKSKDGSSSSVATSSSTSTSDGTANGSSDSISGRRTFSSALNAPATASGGGRKAAQFVTAFDWLKSYAAGQVDLGEDEESVEEEPVKSKKTKSPSSASILLGSQQPSSSSAFGSYTNTGTGSGDDEDYDEEELHLISDTDDVSASVDVEILDSSSGTIAPMLLRRPVFKQLSGLSSSSSSTTMGTSTQGSRAMLSASEMMEDSSNSESASASGNRIGKAFQALSKGGSALGQENFMTSDASSAKGSNDKASKRKTDRPLPRGRDSEDKLPPGKDSKANISLDHNAADAKKSKRASERRKPRDSGEMPSSPCTEPAKPKPKFNRAATAAEGPTTPLSTFTRGSSARTSSTEGSAKLQAATGPTAAKDIGPPGSTPWKKTPDVVKLRKRSVRNTNEHCADADGKSPSSAEATEPAEFEENGILYGRSEATGHKTIHAVSLPKLLDLVFNHWTTERAVREELLSLLPFIGKPADIIEAMGTFWDAKFESMKQSGQLSSRGKKRETGAGSTDLWTTPNALTDERCLQQRLVMFITEWVKTNFTYFSDVVVLEALYRLLDRISLDKPSESSSSSAGSRATASGGPPMSARRMTAAASGSASANATGTSSHTTSSTSGHSSASLKLAGASSTAQGGHGSATAANTSHPKLPSLKLTGLRQGANQAQSSANHGKDGAGGHSSDSAKDSPAERWIERDLLTRIIQYKLAGIDPRDLAAIVVRMQHPKYGIPTLSSVPTLKGTYRTFVGSDAVNWIKKMQDDTIDSMQAAFFKRLHANTKGKKSAAALAQSGTITPSLTDRANSPSTSAASTPHSAITSARPHSASVSTPHSSTPHNASAIPVHIASSGPSNPLTRDSSLVNVLEIDSTEVLAQLLKEKLITRVSSSGRIRDPKPNDPRSNSNAPIVVQKKRTYAITIADHIEANSKLANLELLSRGSPKSESQGASLDSSMSTSGSSALFLSIQPDSFARQLTLMESKLFQRIEIHEMHYWMKGDKERRVQAAPHLNRAIENMNRISLWVATEIVTTANEKQRVSTIKRFILVAQYCLKYRNYQGLLEIIGGLKNSSVTRLARTWAKLPEKYGQMLQTLSNIVDPDQNWKNYRRTVEAEQGACVPYIGLFLSDLTFIYDRGPMTTEDGRINWKKAGQLNAVVTSVRRLQRRAYAFAPDFEILQFITDDLTILGDAELFKRSKVLEASRARSGSIA